jgi:cyclic lactone autoinducer peptide
MKTKKNLMVHMLGIFLIALSGIITCTASFGYIGEPDVPKSLLD